MKPKDRVRRAIRGESVDRVPRFIWVCDAAAQQLEERCGIPQEEIDFRLGNDILQTWLSINGEMARPCAQGERFTDEWGIVWERQGYYNTPVRHPLAGLFAEEIAAYPVPDPHAPARYERLEELKRTYGDDYFIGADVSGAIFEPAYHLRGMEELLVDIALDSEEAAAILDMTAGQTAAIAKEAARRGADWIWLGDDMGTQLSMIMEPGMWRTHFKPRMAAIIREIRDVRPDIPIAYHSCGAVMPILGEIIDLGIDVINPLQESAAGMDHNVIKRLYGDRVTMCCGLDTQQFMVSARPQEVEAATFDILRRLGGSRYIYAVSHTLQPDVPPENILAMIRALDEAESADMGKVG